MSQQEDYFLAFYATEAGRRVHADLRKYVSSIVITAPEMAVGKCMLDDLMRHIREASGVKDELAVISAEAEIAARYKQPEEPKYNLLGE